MTKQSTQSHRQRRKSKLLQVLPWCFAATTLLVAPWARVAQGEYRRASVFRRFAVATDATDASRAAADVLRGGGNAADAAVAAALALGVVRPTGSGFGGGGFATICRPDGTCTMIDFREIAPAALTAEMIQRAPDPARASVLGGLAVGVPGEPAGLLDISRRFGRVPLSRSVAPAVNLARNGFVVSENLAQQVIDQRAELQRDALLTRIWFPNATAVTAGVRVRRNLLANTLERYGREGERYINGAFATSVATAVRAAGGVLTEDDIRNYRPVEREPLTGTFRGTTIVTAPPPSAGGVLLLQTMSWLDAAVPAQISHGSSAYDHVLASAWHGAFDDRARYIGDPGPQGPAGRTLGETLVAPDRMNRRRAGFDPAHATPVVVVEPAHDHGTSHICIADAQGMVVSLTTTVNLPFGARFAVADLDLILNDQIDDFSLGTPGNSFGLANARPNALAQGRRPVSSMSPTVLVRDGHPIGCVGGAGGPRIATATTQVVANVLLHNMEINAAVSAPRIHFQGTPNVLLVDREVPEDVRLGLRARGYTVTETTTPLAGINAVTITHQGNDRILRAATDPRRSDDPIGE